MAYTIETCERSGLWAVRVPFCEGGRLTTIYRGTLFDCIRERSNYEIRERNAKALRCPNCGEHPGAYSTYSDNSVRMDICECCGADEDGCVDYDPRADEEWREERQAEYDEHDPGQSYGEEMRRLHESQV